MYAIAINVGSTFLKCALINIKGDIIYSFQMPSQNVLSEGEMIALINAAIRKCASHAGNYVLGIGIGFPGIIENNVIVGGADNLPGFKNVDLSAIISASTGLNVVVDNDANMMAWGELQYGAGKNCSDVVFLTVGTGIGGGLVINNKLYGGYSNRGSELGHIIINFDGPSCTCGGKGCFEAYASMRALIKEYAGLTGISSSNLSGEIITRNFLAGEPCAVETMERHFDYMSIGVASLINIFSPQKVIIGGGIANGNPFYVAEISKRTKLKAMSVAISNTVVVNAETGNNAALLGCAGRIFSAPVLMRSN
jgi:glucokinase